MPNRIDPPPAETTHTASSGVRATERLEGEPPPPPGVSVVGDYPHYTVGAEIARGGMGRILEAHDRRHDRPVALKVLLRNDAPTRRRFEREAWITGRLQHPSIIPLYEAGHGSTGEPFFAMKLVRGASLADVVRTKRTATERLALLPHLIALADALAYAHDEGIIHRDLKPSNVLVGAFGETVVIDWGLAKVVADDDVAHDPPSLSDEGATPTLTAEGHVLGTPHYMPPEQARGEPIDARADVYALGACMYHTITGAPPFEARTGRETMAKLLAGPPRALAECTPEVPSDLAAIVAKAMDREPANRYATAKELAEDLRRFAKGRLVTAHVYSIRQLLNRWVSRNRASVALSAAFVVALGAISSLGVRRITRERDRAEALHAQADAERNEAVAQRNAAEQMVSALLLDLRSKLMPLGRLDIIGALADSVRTYYQEVRVTDDPAIILQRARVVSDAAGVPEQRGKYEVSTPMFQESIALCERAEALRPGFIDTAIVRGWAWFRIAIAKSMENDYPSALAAYENSARSFADVENREMDPATREQFVQRYAGMLGYRADTLTRIGRLDEAETSGLRAVDLITSALQSSPNVSPLNRMSGKAHVLLCDTHQALGKLTSALSDARSAIEASKKEATANPADKFVEHELAEERRNAGECGARIGDYGTALTTLRASIAVENTLLANDTSNYWFATIRNDGLDALCVVEREIGRLDDATRDCTLELSAIEQQLAEAPTEKERTIRFSRAATSLAETQLAAKHPAAALALIDRASSALARLPALPSTGFTTPQHDALAATHLTRARVAAALHQPDAAALHQPDAAAVADAARDEWTTLLHASPKHIRRADSTVAANVLLADIALASGDRESARAAYATARDTCATTLARTREDVAVRVRCAEAYAKLASLDPDPAHARSLADEARALVADVSELRLKPLRAEVWFRALTSGVGHK